MLEALKPLLESGALGADAQQVITEAWEQRLQEAREQIRVEIREEFAQRYEHDRQVLVQSLDHMVTETLKQEITEFHQDKQALAQQRVQVTEQLRAKAAEFDAFLNRQLTQEITELRQDRKRAKNSVALLEQFVMRQLATELQEFQQDKQALVQTRVRLVQEARGQLQQLKQRFVQRSAAAVKQLVSGQLAQELTQLREDITEAKQNSFGRKIFEAFAGEFGTTQLNQNQHMRQLQEQLQQQQQQLAESQQLLQEQRQQLQLAERQRRQLQEQQRREQLMQELLTPLARDGQRVMRDLLESVQTSQLRSTFDRYLPAVLSGQTPAASGRRVVTESRPVTGDRSSSGTDDNIIDIKRLAGI